MAPYGVTSAIQSASVQGSDLPKQTIRLVIGACGEEKLVMRAISRRVIAKLERPQTVDGDETTRALRQLTPESA